MRVPSLSPSINVRETKAMERPRLAVSIKIPPRMMMLMKVRSFCLTSPLFSKVQSASTIRQTE